MSEVTSVNGKAGEVMLGATDVEATTESVVGQPGGVATLNGSGELPEAQLPSSIVSSSTAAIYVMGTPTGVLAHDMALVEASILAAFPVYGGRLVFGKGAWALNLKLGSLTEGRNWEISGVSNYETVLFPGNSTEPAVTVTGPGTTTSDYFAMRDIAIRLPGDRAYANPVMKIVLQKGQLKIDESVHFYSGATNNPGQTVSYTGTLLVMDGAYEGIVAPIWNTGKYAVPLEFVNETVLPSTGVPPNLDTMRFGGSINGCMGHIFRDAYEDVHGLDFERYKITATIFYRPPAYMEAHISAECAAGSTAVALTTALIAPGAGKVAENLEPGDLITVDFGNLVECNKVVSIEEKGSETVVNVLQPWRYAHTTTPTVIKGGKALSFGKRYSAITLTAFHFESLYMGISADRVNGINLVSGFNNTGQLVRKEGETSNIVYSLIESLGTPNSHVWSQKASYNTAASGTFGGDINLSPPLPPPGRAVSVKTKAGSAILTNVSSFAGLKVGQQLLPASTGVTSNLPSGTKIEELKEGTNEIKMSANATGEATVVLVAVPGYYIAPTIQSTSANQAISVSANSTAGSNGSLIMDFMSSSAAGNVGKTQAWQTTAGGTVKAFASYAGTVGANKLAVAGELVPAETVPTLTMTPESPGEIGVRTSHEAKTIELPALSEVETGATYTISDAEGKAATHNITIQGKTKASEKILTKGGTAQVESIALSENGGSITLRNFRGEFWKQV